MRVPIRAALAAVLLLAAPLSAAAADRGLSSGAVADGRNSATARSATAVETYLHRSADGKIEARGVLEVIEVDPTPGTKDYSERRYELTVEGGRRVQLELPKTERAKALSAGQVVEASGVQRSGATGTTAMRVSTFTTDGEVTPYGPRPITADPSTQRGPTNRRVLVIPIVYESDGPTGNFNLPDIMARLGGPSPDTTAAFFRAASGGDDTAAAPATAGDLNHTFELADVVRLGGTRPAVNEQCSANPELNVATVNVAANIDPLSSAYGAYDHYMYLYPCEKQGVWGEARVPGTVSEFYNYDVLGWPTPVFTHELGHSLGLPHEALLICKSGGVATPLVSAADRCRKGSGVWSDVMGPGGLLMAYHRARLGFLPMHNVLEVAPAEGRVATVLSSTTRRSLGTTQLIQIPRPRAASQGDARPYFFVSIRTGHPVLDPLPTGHPLQTGLEIMAASPVEGNIEETHTVATHPLAEIVENGVDGAGNPIDPTPTMPVGETRFKFAHSLTAGRRLYDPLEDFTITAQSVAADGSQADVLVEPGPPHGAATSAAVFGRRLIVRAGAGAINSIAVAVDGSDLVIGDAGNVVTAGGSSCVGDPLDSQVVRCDAAEIDFIDIRGGDGADQLSVASQVDKPVSLYGEAGDDTLVAAGSGADQLFGGAGQDFLDPAGPGIDTLSFADETSSVRLDQVNGPKAWRVITASGEDEIARAGTTTVEFERLIGGSGNDILRWTQGAYGRTVDGGPGSDTIRTGTGADTVLSRDGLADASVDCNQGIDTVDADTADPNITSCNTGAVGTVITSGPSEGSTSNASSSAFVFRNYTGTATTETFECNLRPTNPVGVWGACPQTYAVGTLTAGAKTLSVRSVVNGTRSTAVSVRRFTVDKTAPPTANITSPAPPFDTGRYLQFWFSSLDGSVRFSCRLNGVEQPCQSPMSYADLGAGTYNFDVRSIDEAGNVASAWSAAQTRTVVRSLPDTQITGGPAGSTGNATSQFTLASTGPAAAGFGCRVTRLDVGVPDPPAFAPCSAATSHTTSVLENGRYRFEARARTAAGLTDQSPASRDFTVVSAAGVASLTGNTLTVTAMSGRENQLRIRTGSNATVTIEDVLPLRGVGCFQATTERVICSTTGVSSIVVDAGDLDDRIDAKSPIATTLRGGAGNDLLLAQGAGADRIEGGAGTDTASYAGAATAVTASLDGTQNDGPAGGAADLIAADVESLVGGPLADTLRGGPAASVLSGLDGNDTLIAGTGGTRFVGSLGSDTLTGGAGADVAEYSDLGIGQISYVGTTGKVTKALVPEGSADSPDFYLNTSTLVDSLGASIEGVEGSQGSDQFVDTAGNDLLKGAGGADTFAMTGGGNDVVHGGDGADSYTDGPGNDVFNGDGDNDVANDGFGDDIYNGQEGDDVVKLAVGGGRDIVNGGSNSDSAQYGAYTQPVKVTPDGLHDDGPTGVTADQDLVGVDVERLAGGQAADTLIGSVTTLGLSGSGGNDTLVLAAGSIAAPLVNGGAGVDTFDFRAETQSATISISIAPTVAGSYQLGTRSSTLLATEVFFAGSGNDVMSVDVGLVGDPAITFDGGLGNDTLNGGREVNTLRGGAGNDTISGGLGIDTIDGGDGADKINAKDGLAETVACGIGTPDEATLDASDSSSGCETIVN